ncbi:MAG TPA: L-2-amino-thiazoline-4-carboxylic acid hydrolase, partial [Desulfobacteria bacterium]|nr:L-2-amino-thiazoline-4-carboxylic acid hydrolase [Desulfobacteria bacterium]
MEKEQLEVDQAVTYVRNAIADRATWFYLLVKEIEAAGGNAEHIARKAVFQFGCLKGGKMNPTTNMREFVAEFSPGLGRKVFANEVKEIDENHAVIEFSHCPLAACWKNLGCSPQ